MTWTVDQSGTTAALTIGSETQLGSNATTNATYALKVNLSNLALGDILEVRIYTEDVSAGTVVQAFKGSYSNAQVSPLVVSPPLPSDISYKATLKQTAGSGRTFAWEILRI